MAAKAWAALSEIDITPLEPVDLSGLPVGLSRGILEPLTAQLLLLREADAPPLLLATLDTLVIPQDWGDATRAALAHEAGTDSERVMLCASHTHSGPALMRFRRWGDPQPSYMALAADRLVEAVAAMRASLRPVTVRFGRSQARGISVNRREAEGPLDPTVTVLSLEESPRKPLATLLHFACHPVCLWGYRNLVAPDYPGIARRLLASRIGGAVLFVNGAAGNVNPAGFDRWKTSVPYAEGVARTLADAALTAWEGAAPLRGLPLRAAHASRTVPLLPPPSAEEVQRRVHKAQATIDADPDEVRRDPGLYRMLDWAAELDRAARQGTLLREETLEVQAFRLGEVALVALPGEPYVEVGARILRESPFRHTLVAGYSNGYLGYLCSRAWQEKNGGEQEKFISTGLLSLPPQTEDIVCEASRALLSSLARADS